MHGDVPLDGRRPPSFNSGLLPTDARCPVTGLTYSSANDAIAAAMITAVRSFFISFVFLVFVRQDSQD